MVNLNPLLMVLLYIPSNFFLANLMFKKAGVYWTVALGCILECACLWTRVLINEGFFIAMIAGFFYGIAQPLVMNASAEIASNWFATSEVPSSADSFTARHCHGIGRSSWTIWRRFRVRLPPLLRVIRGCQPSR